MIVDLTDKQVRLDLAKAKRDYLLAFTSGCFDLLHSGHIYFIQNALQQITKPNTKLLIALHSDAEITKHKGKDRPIFPLENRLLLLDNIKRVDLVGGWNGWEDIIELVYDIEPDYLITTEDKAQAQNWDNNWQAVAQRIKAELIIVKKINTNISTTGFIKKLKTQTDE